MQLALLCIVFLVNDLPCYATMVCLDDLLADNMVMLLAASSTAALDELLTTVRRLDARDAEREQRKKEAEDRTIRISEASKRKIEAVLQKHDIPVVKKRCSSVVNFNSAPFIWTVGVSEDKDTFQEHVSI